MMTPSDGVAGDEKLAAGGEGSYDESVKIKPLAEHPHEVTRDQVLRYHVQVTTPDLTQHITASSSSSS